jgi:ArsR family transcriptional regulator
MMRSTAAVDELVAVVSEPNRARIVAELARESLCTCHLVEILGAGQTAVSNHLRVLRLAGVVDAIPAGRYTYYELRPAAVQALAEHYAGMAASARDVERRPC